MSRRRSSSPLSGLMGLLQMIVLIGEIPANILSAQRHIDAQNARIALDHERVRESRQKQAVTEHEAHLRSNKVVIADLDIEIRKLQLLKLQKELGLDAPDFNPTDYS